MVGGELINSQKSSIMATQTNTNPKSTKRPLEENDSDLYDADKRNRMDSDTDMEPSSDSDAEVEMFPGNTWPRFLIVESMDESNPISKISPFAVAKAIQGIAGEPKEVKTLKDGLLIEVGRKAHAVNLVKAKMFANIPVKVSPHKSMNTRKVVIRCNSLENDSEDDICEELKHQDVISVKRICKDKGQTPTNTFIITFGTTVLPEAVKIGYMRVRVNPYIPFPLRCFKCQRYGHGKDRCRGKDTCPNCGENHEVEDCISCLLYTSPSPRDGLLSRMPSSA